MLWRVLEDCVGLGGDATGEEKLVVFLGRRGSRVSTFSRGIFGDKEVDWIGASGLIQCSSINPSILPS